MDVDRILELAGIIQEDKFDDLFKLYSKKFKDEELRIFKELVSMIKGELLRKFDKDQKLAAKYAPWCIRHAVEQISGLLTKAQPSLTYDIAASAYTRIQQMSYYLKKFEEYNKIIPNKDIMTYKTNRDLMAVIHQAEKKLGDENNQVKIKKVYSDDKLEIIIPLTTAASCKYGANTKWCISGREDNMFKTYTEEQGMIFAFIIFKQGVMKYERYSKIAVQYNTSSDYVESFWDKVDNQFGPDKFFEIMDNVYSDAEDKKLEKVLHIIENLHNYV